MKRNIFVMIPFGTILMTSCLHRNYHTSSVNQASNQVKVYIRGDFNQWQNQELLGSSFKGGRDFVTIPPCASGTAEFKFDLTGDWSRNFGDNDNVRGFNPSANRWEGELDPNGGNIKIPCGKTYFISMEHYFSESRRYGYLEVEGEVKQDVDAGRSVTFRKAIGGGGQYGAVDYTGEILVRHPEKISNLGVSFRSASGQIFAEAKYRETLKSGVQIWNFVASGYGRIDLETISYLEGDTKKTSPIDFKWVK
jgi:hypothetical protein